MKGGGDEVRVKAALVMLRHKPQFEGRKENAGSNAGWKPADHEGSQARRVLVHAGQDIRENKELDDKLAAILVGDGADKSAEDGG